MDEFEKIKTFSESLVERQQKIDTADEAPKDELDLPKYLSQFRAVPVQEEEKESKRLLWIVLLLCVIIVGFVIFALTKRLPEMEEGEIIVISPTPTPVKILPENPGGLNIPDRDKVVYNRLAESAPAPVVETLFPEPEQPMMPTEMVEPENKEEVVVSAADLTMEKTPETQAQSTEIVVEAPESEIDIPLVEETQLVIQEETENAPQDAPPVPRTKPIEVEERQVVEAQKEEPKISGPIWRAQLLSSASKAKVESSWKTISKEYAALLSDMPYQIISATIPGKGTFWRLQVGEFSTKEMVINLCTKLKKKKQECIPVK